MDTVWAPCVRWGLCSGVGKDVACGFVRGRCAVVWCWMVGFPGDDRHAMPTMGLQGLDELCSVPTLPTKAELSWEPAGKKPEGLTQRGGNPWGGPDLGILKPTGKWRGMRFRVCAQVCLQHCSDVPLCRWTY